MVERAFPSGTSYKSHLRSNCNVLSGTECLFHQLAQNTVKNIIICDECVIISELDSKLKLIYKTKCVAYPSRAVNGQFQHVTITMRFCLAKYYCDSNNN